MSPLFASTQEALLYRRAALRRDGHELTEAERVEVSEIDDALARIAGGQFGHCEVCGRAMGWQRLRAAPETRRCLDCA